MQVYHCLLFHIMGLLDNMFSKKKETIKTRTARTVSLKKEPENNQQAASSRVSRPPSNVFIFGSLRRGQSGVAASTPKGTSSTTNPNGVKKAKASVELKNKPPDKEKRPWFRATNNILRKEPIKSSTASLSVNAVQKVSNATDLKKKRPASVSTVAANVTVRRGQNAKLDGQNLPDNLSRTSSITNLDAEQKSNKGAKPRKSASRDKIDKIGENKKNEKKGVTKNNNKLESGDSPYPSIDSLQEEEFLQLRRQLQEMAQEKSNLALQLGEQKGQLNILQKEIEKLKEESNLQLEHLTDENTALRNRLRDVAHSPLSDNEKQQLLFESRHHSSAPASIATNLADEGNGGDITACPTPDWDKHSSSNVSEVSVACLQDKINQMQETHYSTNEELQATLQELTDLQRQLTELQQENERLNEEKTLMFDSLCRQTERLNDSRSEVESLKQLLYREKDDTGQYESVVEREQRLVDLLKAAQEEREVLLVKLEQINNEIQEARAGIIEKDERIMHLSDRVRTLECTLDAKHAEHKLLDQELAQAKDQCSARQIEINRLTDLLDNARTKINELEQDRALSDKSELDELLDNARKEKDALESEVAHLKEQLAISKNEIEKLKEQVSILQEECKVIRNNAKTTQSDLEYKCEKLLMEKNALNDQLQEFQEAVNELQHQSQCQLEDKRQLSAVLSETQRNLSEAERTNLSLKSELQELTTLRGEENEEWEKFQSDLLTSVRVANDFKTEAQQELQRMILENKSYRERERQLKAEIDKLKGDETKREELSRTKTSKSKLSDKENIPNKEMESLLKLSRKHRDKPRKSKDGIEPISSSANKERNPDALTKPVKKRERQSGRAKKNKTLSVEEEILLKSLDDWYENIDKNVPEEKLTEEEKVVKKLKTLYEDNANREKPVAHKPKDQLAISKPLLDSVFLNPKLEEIVKDPNVPTVEEIGKSDAIPYENEELELRYPAYKTSRKPRVKSEDFGQPERGHRISIIGRSRSVDDLHISDKKGGNQILYRSTETEDLRNEIPLEYVPRESSILPSDSVSNPRYSNFSSAIHHEENHNELEKRFQAAKVTRKSSVNYETLERIVASIPKGTPDHQLSSEKKFALKLKKALDEAKKKNTLRKRKLNKNVVIGYPLLDSVKKNPVLRDILLDPRIKSIKRRKCESESKHTAPPPVGAIRQSKSYQDITFTFENDRKNTVSMYSGESIEEDSCTFNISSCESAISTEVGVERDSTSLNDSTTPVDLKTFRSLNEDISVCDVTGDTTNRLPEKDKYDSLIYNETLKKMQNLKQDKGIFTCKDQDLPHNCKPGKLLEDLDEHKYSNAELFNNLKIENSDLLYNETLKKGYELPDKSDKINEMLQKVTECQDFDLTYNETVNRKVRSHATEDKDDQDAVKDNTDYQNTTKYLQIKATRDHHVALGYREIEPYDMVETVGKYETLKNERKISDISQDVSDGNQYFGLLYTETLNEDVKFPKDKEILHKGRYIEEESDAAVINKTDVISYVNNNDYKQETLENISATNDPNSIQILKAYFPETQQYRKINDNFSKGYEDISSDIVDDVLTTEKNDEYNYHSILKENRYGVTTPLNTRLIYKDVVKEIKHRFPHIEENDVEEEKDYDEDDDLEQTDTFFDEFFGIKRTGRDTEHQISEDVSYNVIDIDREMEEIFEKYLHTPISKVITQIEEKKEDKIEVGNKFDNSKETKRNENDDIADGFCLNRGETSLTSEVDNDSEIVKGGDSIEEYSTGRILSFLGDNQKYVHEENDNLRKEVNVTLSENNIIKYDENGDHSIEEIVLGIDDSHTEPKHKENEIKGDTINHTAEGIRCDESSLKEIVLIIKDNQKDSQKAVNTTGIVDRSINQIGDHISFNNGTEEVKKLSVPEESRIKDNDKTTPSEKKISVDLDKQILIYDKTTVVNQLPDIIESVNKNVTYNSTDKATQKSDSNNLMPEEFNLVRSVKQNRSSRPLSDFNEKDFQIIQEISAHYVPKVSMQKEDGEINKKKLEMNEPLGLSNYKEIEKYANPDEQILKSTTDHRNNIVASFDKGIGQIAENTGTLRLDAENTGASKGKEHTINIQTTSLEKQYEENRTRSNKKHGIGLSDVSNLPETSKASVTPKKIKIEKEVEDDLDTILAKIVTPISKRTRYKNFKDNKESRNQNRKSTQKDGDLYMNMENTGRQDTVKEVEFHDDIIKPSRATDTIKEANEEDEIKKNGTDTDKNLLRIEEPQTMCRKEEDIGSYYTFPDERKQSEENMPKHDNIKLTDKHIAEDKGVQKNADSGENFNIIESQPLDLSDKRDEQKVENKGNTNVDIIVTKVLPKDISVSDTSDEVKSQNKDKSVDNKEQKMDINSTKEFGVAYDQPIVSTRKRQQSRENVKLDDITLDAVLKSELISGEVSVISIKDSNSMETDVKTKNQNIPVSDGTMKLTSVVQNKDEFCSLKSEKEQEGKIKVNDINLVGETPQTCFVNNGDSDIKSVVNNDGIQKSHNLLPEIEKDVNAKEQDTISSDISGTKSKMPIISSKVKEMNEECKSGIRTGSDSDMATTPQHEIVLLKRNKAVGTIDKQSDTTGAVNLGGKKPYTEYVLRKNDYQGVKSRLDYFSMKSGENTTNRQSFSHYSSKTITERRNVKSWADHFEKRSLDTHSYEPVYANYKMLSPARNVPTATTKIEKKPLPIPRLKNHSRPSSVENLDRCGSVVQNDRCLKEVKMTDSKNFSEDVAKNVLLDVSGSGNNADDGGTNVSENYEQRNVSESFKGPTVSETYGKQNISESYEKPNVSESYGASNLGLEAANFVEDDKSKKTGEETIAIKKSEKFLRKPSAYNIKPEEDDTQNNAAGAESSFSAIAVAGKFEQLDITKHSDNDIEDMDNNNQSKLNLFQIETPSYDESYLNLFKQPEDKVYDKITGRKKPQRGFFNIAYIGEMSDNDSLEELEKHTENKLCLEIDESKPRIIDFVPLDGATKPVFKKSNLNEQDYDTLEREKTFHVLNIVSSDVKIRKSPPKMEGSKGSLSSSSRTSFSAAKKVFEALLEANSDKNADKKVLRNKKSIYELAGKTDIRTSSTSVGLIEAEKVEKMEK